MIENPNILGSPSSRIKLMKLSELNHSVRIFHLAIQIQALLPKQAERIIVEEQKSLSAIV